MIDELANAKTIYANLGTAARLGTHGGVAAVANAFCESSLNPLAIGAILFLSAL